MTDGSEDSLDSRVGSRDEGLSGRSIERLCPTSCEPDLLASKAKSGSEARSTAEKSKGSQQYRVVSEHDCWFKLLDV